MSAKADGAAPLLVIEGLRKSFGGIQAVGGVSLEVGAGEIVGIIGPNGSGKSTLFNLIAGAFRPDAGRIILAGRDVTGWKPYRIARAGIGRTFQIPALFLNMTAEANLRAAAVEGDWATAPRRAAEVLELLKLEHVRDTQAGDLSGGQQKLIELGRTLMRDPPLILLDEVTAGVHVNIRAVALDSIRALRARGKAFMVIEHDMEFVRTLCDRIHVMDFGELVASGSFEEIASDKQVVSAYLGRPA